MTERQERIVLRLVMANVVLLLIAPIGGGTIVEGVVALLGSLR